MHRFAQLVARGQVGCVVDRRRQRERMQFTIDPDETSHRLLVVPPCFFGTVGQAQHGRQIHQNPAEKILRTAGSQARLVGFAGEFLRTSKITDSTPGVNQIGRDSERVHVIRAQVVAGPVEYMLALLHRVPVMTGLAQRVRKPVARVKPENVLPAADRLERIDGLACRIQRFLIEAEAAQVASYRAVGVKCDQVVRTQDPAAILEVTLVDLQGITEAAKPEIVTCNIIPYIHGTFVIYAEGRFQFWQYAQVVFQCLAELAVRAQVLAVEDLTHQEHLESVAVGISLERRADLQDQAMSVGGAATYVHRDGDLHGHGQHLQVILAEAFPPYSQRILTELQRLDMGAAQP